MSGARITRCYISRMLRRSLIWLLIGMGSAVAALLPWIITGMRLPLQNLWGSDTLPDGMPVALLPFSQYYVAALASLLIIGWVIAGVIGRGRKAPWTLIVGVLLAQVIALIQTAVVVGRGLSDRAASTIYLVGITSGAVVAMVLGIVLFILFVRAPRPGVVIAVSLAAIAASVWLDALFTPIGHFSVSSPLTDIARATAQYLPAIVVGLAIAWAGVNTVGRVVAAVGALLVTWVGSTAVLAATVVLGTRVIAGQPAEMVEYGVSVFKTALVSEGGPLWVGLIAALSAFLSVVARLAVSRARPGSRAPTPQRPHP